MDSLVIGASTTSSVGSSLFSSLSGVVGTLGPLSVALAVATIICLVVRFVIHPTSEAATDSIDRLRRILITIAFIAGLGAIVSWIFASLGVGAPFGFWLVTNL